MHILRPRLDLRNHSGWEEMMEFLDGLGAGNIIDPRSCSRQMKGINWIRTGLMQYSSQKQPAKTPFVTNALYYSW